MGLLLEKLTAAMDACMAQTETNLASKLMHYSLHTQKPSSERGYKRLRAREIKNFNNNHPVAEFGIFGSINEGHRQFWLKRGYTQLEYGCTKT